MAEVSEDVIATNILSRLSAKSLVACRSLSKNLNDIISSDPNIAISQSRNYDDSSSKAFIFLHRTDPTKRKLLSLFPPPLCKNRLIGIPDPALQFLHLDDDVHDKIISISASTHGLLCLNVSSSYASRGSRLFVCNPVTRAAHPVPDSNRKDNFVGLAFDPSVCAHSYKLVNPIMTNLGGLTDGVEYTFEVFSSRDQTWALSARKVTLPSAKKNKKPVFAAGVVYWPCGVEYLLWYDCEGDRAGYATLPTPKPAGPWDPQLVLAEIGVRNGRVTCSQVTPERGLEVWELADNRREWVMKQGMSLDWAVLNEKLNMRMSSRKRKRVSDDDDDDGERTMKRYWMRPLPFDGGEKVYVRVKLRPPTEKTSKFQDEWEKLLRFDLRTREIAREPLDENLGLRYDDVVFGYENKLTPVPILA